MPRTKRLISSEYPLHIMVRGNNKQALFREDRDKRCYLGLVSRFRTQSRIDIYHYCLMNNHVHLLLQAQKPDLLSKFMMKIDLSYFFIFQNKYGYVGHLFQNRFKSTIINCDTYLLQCGKYIELNPVRAGMIAAPEDYLFSSYRYYAYGANDRLVSMDPVYTGLSDEEDRRRKLYREFVVDSASISTEKLRRSLFIGGEDFRRRMEREFGVAGELRPRGRPSKNKQDRPLFSAEANPMGDLSSGSGSRGRYFRAGCCPGPAPRPGGDAGLAARSSPCPRRRGRHR